MNLYIIRGLPGSGKTTFAKRIANAVFEADMFFMKDGEYKYSKEEIGKAHDWCKYWTEAAMKNEVHTIAVSNTFVKRWEMEPYYLLADKYGYTTVEVTLTGKLYDNVHGVPTETIERMKANWEV